MATPTVYVICDQNCKFEGMTKEQILTAITQAVNEGTIGDIDTGFVTTIKTINGTALKFFVGDQATYDELTDAEKINLFAVITNDTTKEGILAAIAELQTETAANTAAIQTNTVNITNNTNKISAHSTRLSIAETNIEDITASMAAQNKEIEANTKAIAENAAAIASVNIFSLAQTVAISKGVGTLPSTLVGRGVYLALLTDGHNNLKMGVLYLRSGYSCYCHIACGNCCVLYDETTKAVKVYDATGETLKEYTYTLKLYKLGTIEEG